MRCRCIHVEDDGRAFGDAFVDDVFDPRFACLAVQSELCSLGDEPVGAAGYRINADELHVDYIALTLELCDVGQESSAAAVGASINDGEGMTFIRDECCSHWSSSVVAVVYSCVPR
jgi:hypothetical protein